MKIGQHVILYENTPAEINFDNCKDVCKRLYVITGLNINPSGKGYGTVVMRHHQEARMARDLKGKNGAYKIDEDYRAAILMLHTQFKALVEGADFILTPLGEVKLLHEVC